MTGGRTPAEVLIAGGGVAAAEALIAVAELVPSRVHLTLVAPGPDLVLPGAKIGESFHVARRSRVPLGRLAGDFGATYLPDRVVAVDAGARTVRCASGRTLPYDSLIVAPGAIRTPASPHAEMVGDERGDAMLHGILADLEEGYLKRVAFVAPPTQPWTLPLYELALLVAADASGMGIDDARLTVVSAEERPLGLFGPQASEQVARLLEARGIAFAGGVHAEVRHGEVLLRPGERRLAVERTFALPDLHGPALPGLPCDDGGFIRTDVHGRVPGLDGVFAAGDATDFPVKQGGLAAQQAEAAAQSVAARHGCAIDPEPFRPVLQGRLLTGAEDLYLRHAIGGGDGEGRSGAEAAWWPPLKTAAGRLGPYLYGVEAAVPGTRSPA